MGENGVDDISAGTADALDSDSPCILTGDTGPQPARPPVHGDS